MDSQANVSLPRCGESCNNRLADFLKYGTFLIRKTMGWLLWISIFMVILCEWSCRFPEMRQFL